MKLTTIARLFVITAAALSLGMVPKAQANDKGCSNATLKGTYACSS